MSESGSRKVMRDIDDIMGEVREGNVLTGGKRKSKGKKASKKTKKTSIKQLKRQTGGKWKSSSKKQSTKKRSTKKQRGGANAFMTMMLSLKKTLKAKLGENSKIKDGPAMSKQVSAYIKSNGSDEKKALESILKDLSSGKLEKEFVKINDEMKKKREAKKAAKS